MTATEISPTNLNLKLDQAALALYKSRPPKSIHASGFFNCGRQQFYGLTNEPPTDNNPWLGFEADIGNVIHEKLQERLVKAGLCLLIPSFSERPQERLLDSVGGKLWPAIEVPMTQYTLSDGKFAILQKHRIGGRIDAVIVQRSGPAIFEIKTVGNKYLNEPNYQKYFVEKLAHYELQVQLYMHLFEAPGGVPVHNGLIYVVNQSNHSDTRLYSVRYNPEFMESELERVLSIKEAVDASTAPRPEPWRGGCRFCNWRTLCPAGEAEKR